MRELLESSASNQASSSNSGEVRDLGLRYGLATRHTSVYGKSGQVSFMSVPAGGVVSMRPDSAGGYATSSDSDTALPLQAGSGSGSDTPPTRKVYDSKFLLTFREHYTELPEGLPSIDIILGKGGAAKPRTSSRDANNHRKGSSNGRDGRDRGRGKQTPAAVPVEPLKQTDGRWQRPSSDVAATELLQRNVLGLLNKLTLEKFGSLSSQFAALKISNLDDLMEVSKLVFEKAILEQHFCSMYADLCKKLSEAYPSFTVVEDGRNVTQTFKRLLLNMCQKEFECPPPAKDPPPSSLLPTADSQQDKSEADDAERKYRIRTLGNIRFIGELFKLGLLREAIMHSCVARLLSPAPSSSTLVQNGSAVAAASTSSTEEDLEALCKLLRTMGKRLDKPGADREKMDRYFTTIASLSTNRELPSRSRFMLVDLMDLRKNEWVPRREVNGPKTIAAVHADVCYPPLSFFLHAHPSHSFAPSPRYRCLFLYYQAERADRLAKEETALRESGAQRFSNSGRGDGRARDGRDGRDRDGRGDHSRSGSDRESLRGSNDSVEKDGGDRAWETVGKSAKGNADKWEV